MIDIKYPGEGKTFFTCNGNTDNLKDFNAAVHKGVLYDDVGVKGTTVTGEMMLQLLSVKDGSTVQCRYNNGHVPAGTYKIFTSNITLEKWLPENLTKDHKDAIFSRVVSVECKDRIKLYKTSNDEEEKDGEDNRQVTSIRIHFDSNY
jgi:hypothetical protein